MYFDFEDRFEDYQPVGGGLRRWDGVALSVGVHVVVILIALLIPTLDLFGRAQKLAELQQQLEEQKKRERPEFVFVQPKVDMKALRAPNRAEMSDIDRESRATERSPERSNPLPSARGNSTERVEASPELRARGQGPDPDPSPEPPKEVVEQPVEPPRDQRQAQLSLPQQQQAKPSGGSLGEALKNLQKYVDQESFNNQRGNVQDLGPLQFDTKGVEFGPWIRRFVSQVRRNWFIPYAAMTMRGHVVLTFFVHRNGALTDVTVIQPSPIESFNTAAVNALRASNPTEPLPPEYPDDKAFFTVTFYYNESPGR
jgi:TonB family protein